MCRCCLIECSGLADDNLNLSAFAPPFDAFVAVFVKILEVGLEISFLFCLVGDGELFVQL